MKYCTSAILGTLPLLAVASIGLAQQGGKASFSSPQDHPDLANQRRLTTSPNAASNGGVAGACGNITITHSLDPFTITPGSVSCNAGGLHTDNSYFRTFELADFSIDGPFTPCAVDVGIETAAAGNGMSQPVEIRIYDTADIDNLGFPVFSQTYEVMDQDETIMTFDTVAAPSILAGGGFTVEVFTPDGQTDGNSFFIGSNANGETAPSYLLAADCGVDTPTTTGAIGFPDMQIVMTVIGTGKGGTTCLGDTNGDGQVNVTDLINVITTWGSDGQGDGFDADINGDGTVDVTDLVNGVITNWGPCPVASRACCFDDASCQDLAPQDCIAAGGAVQGVDSECATTECVAICGPGAGSCDEANGTPGCDDVECCQAVCAFDSFCCDNEWDQLCADNAAIICDPTPGACCFDDGTCEVLSFVECDEAGAVIFQGAGTTCESDPCPQPADNDLCENAATAVDGSNDFDNTLAETDGPEHPECEKGFPDPQVNNDVWFDYVATNTGPTVFSLCGNPETFDGKLALYEGCECPVSGDNLIECNDDGCGVFAGPSVITAGTVEGTCYKIRVGNFAGTPGVAGVLDISPLGLPEDVCEFAREIAPGDTELVDLTDASPDESAPVCGSNPSTGSGVWLRAVGDGTTYTVEVCIPAGGDFGLNSRLIVYCGPCSDLVCVGEATTGSTCAPFTEQLTWCTAVGAEYYILVSAAGAEDVDEYEVELTSNGTDCSTPPCSGACCVEGMVDCFQASGAGCAAMGGVYFGDDTDCAGVFCLDPCDTPGMFLTQSSSEEIVGGNSVSCNAGGIHADNSYFRSYSGLGARFDVCNVEFGIEVAASGDGSGEQPVLIRLYDSPLPGTFASLGTPFAQRLVMVPDGLDGTLVTYDITGTTFTGDLTVEIFTPDGDPDGTGVPGHTFFIGSNPDGETGPSYLAAPDCAIDDPTPTADIGFPEMNIILNVNNN